jgi:16S rRNA (guanine527-N7)-methyltransferase
VFHVKHSDAIALISEMLGEMSLSVDVGVQITCVDYLDAVLRENEAINLTAVTDRVSALRLHVVDSMAVLPEVAAAPAGRLIDLGTGGGFPGVPLALASKRVTALVDSVRKKIDAIERCLGEARVPREGISSVWARAEELAQREPATAAVVVARAVAELPVLVELAAPLLQDGGRLVALKGSLAQDEDERGHAAADLVGLKGVETRKFRLPGGNESRAVVVYEKVGPATLQLPRRVGMAAKRPLA